MHRFLFASALWLCASVANAQIDEDALGMWYVFNWNYAARPNQVFGAQGDIQYRNWRTSGDMDQRLIRGGLTWTPSGSSTRFTLGYANVSSGAFGPSNRKSREHRLYQEILLNHTLGEKLFLTHRFRFEQRDLDGQDFRTRLRYQLGINYPLNQATLGKGAVYLTFNNELFYNLQHSIGKGRNVDYFDRNRAALGLGYSVSNATRLIVGVMRQHVDTFHKDQVQLTLTRAF